MCNSAFKRSTESSSTHKHFEIYKQGCTGSDTVRLPFASDTDALAPALLLGRLRERHVCVWVNAALFDVTTSFLHKNETVS